MIIQPVMPEIDFALDPLPDLEERLRQLQEAGHELVPVNWIGETAWLVLGYDNIAAAVEDEKRIPAATDNLITWNTHGAQPLKDEGDKHKESRGILEMPFKPSKVREKVESVLRPLADRLIDDLGDLREVDLVTVYTRRYPFLVISAMLGVPLDRASEERLEHLVFNLLLKEKHAAGRDVEARRAATVDALSDLNAFLRPIVEARQKEPQDDVISYLLAATRNDGQPLPLDVVYDYIRFLYPAGAETTASGLARLISGVLSDEALRDRLIANPKDRAAAVEEGLRFSPPAHLLPRLLKEPTTICGTELAAGTKILLALGQANRDPTIFPDPDNFNIDQRRKALMTFGRGAHFCLGSNLARAEFLISLDRLLDRLPGLRLIGPPPEAMGAVFRWIPELKVRFDDILPAV